MLYIARWKAALILLVCVLGVIFSVPNILSEEERNKLPAWMQNTFNLGLELQGGSHLQLEVDMKSVMKDYSENLLDEIRTTLRAEKIGYTSLTLTQDRKGVTFMLLDPSQVSVAKKALRKTTNELNFDFDSLGRVTISLTDEATEKVQAKALEKSIEVIRRRVDESGTKEPLIQRQGTDRIILQLPGVDNPAEVKRLIGRTAKMEFRLVDHDAGTVQVDASGRPQGAIPLGSEILPETGHRGQEGYVVVKKQVSITGDRLIDAQFEFREAHPGVSISFDAVGAKKFAEITANNVNRQFAIILDGRVISHPNIKAPLLDGHAIISGGFTPKEAQELALLLRAGALPAALNVIEERTVGPSLGADSIQDGQRATLFAFLFVAVFMILNYSLFGAFADIALAFNLVLLFAALSLLGATLTLPGIAGIALTIGMAVDANVLIYERIKEELRNKMKPVMAIDAGYRKALMTILDSNITTLIGAAVLFEFGSGPIRGFAVTLALGIIISLFTALSLTRLIVIFWARRQRNLTSLPI
jgi:preprotein translocase subunit SecD